MQILDENSVNYLILKDDGSTVTKSKSSELNTLLFQHRLYDLLEEGSEMWSSSGFGGAFPAVHIHPDDNAECYTLQIMDGDYPKLTLGKHQKTDLVSALANVYEGDERTVEPLLDLYDSIRADMIRKEALDGFASAFGDKVRRRDDGWFIYDHLLLTWEGELHHPQTESRERSGQQVIGASSTKVAYNVQTENIEGDIERNITHDGTEWRLTDGEVQFLAKAVWAVKNSPDRREL
jgi:hypothetical protein